MRVFSLVITIKWLEGYTEASLSDLSVICVETQWFTGTEQRYSSCLLCSTRFELTLYIRWEWAQSQTCPSSDPTQKIPFNYIIFRFPDSFHVIMMITGQLRHWRQVGGMRNLSVYLLFRWFREEPCPSMLPSTNQRHIYLAPLICPQVWLWGYMAMSLCLMFVLTEIAGSNVKCIDCSDSSLVLP